MLIQDKSTVTAKEIIDRKKISQNWMATNYYGEWEQVAKNYRCERDPEKLPDGTEDTEATSVGTPLTASYVNRAVARVTANMPNIKFRSKDPGISELISRKLMYDWDRGHAQRYQKRHVRQALLFGWSVKAWYWSVEEYDRKKRVDPNHPNPELRMAARAELDRMYKVPENYGGLSLARPEMVGAAEADVQEVISSLLVEYGRGGLLPVQYPYKAFEGPKSEVLSVADLYPEPQFQSIQDSNWFIVERRRNISWIQSFLLAYKDQYPELAKGFDKLLEKYPKGTQADYQTGSGESEYGNFRRYLLNAYPSQDFYNEDTRTRNTQTWTITEEHVPGRKPMLRFVAEQDILIGEIPYPYDLDGRIAFTELVFIDDLLGGIGDANARLARGIQELHNRSFSIRTDLYDTLSRPLVGTNDRELLEDPSKIRRYRGMRLFYARGGSNSMWVQPEQAALASAAASLQSNTELIQMWQMCTGENNMSSMANVDPQQNRTATGVRTMSYNQDILSKDMIDMYTQTGLKPDAEMMFMLNRSEMCDPVDFESNRYNRSYDGPNLIAEEWAKAEPLMFQVDGEITVQTGSTLADDDEAKVAKANTIAQTALARPDLFNQQKAAQELLIALGQGDKLAEWAPPPPQPPPPPPPEQPKLNGSVSIPLDKQAPETQMQLLAKFGIQAPVPVVPPPPEGAPATPPMAGAPPLSAPQTEDGVPGLMIPEDQDIGVGAYAASRGANPLREEARA